MAIRVLPVNSLSFDQVDFFQTDFFTRVTGLTPGDLTLELFFNNGPVSWTLTSGVGVTDAQVVAGNVYFQELDQPGYYGLRFRPNAVGYWRLVLNYPVGVQGVGLDYDVVLPPAVASGLTASFTR